MKTLYLIRHAKSSWDEPGLADIDRPLNGRGRKNAPMMGAELAAQGFRPDRIVSSPANRAFTTACAIAAEIGYDVDQVATDRRIYEAGVATLLGIVNALDDRLETVALVGHNPGFTLLANHLTGGNIDNVPTCGVVSIEFACDSWREVAPRSGRQQAFIYPRMYEE